MNFVLPFLLAFLVSAILTPIVAFFANKFGFVDDPKRHKHPAMIHTRSVPRGGGLPIYIGVVVASLVFIGISKKIMGVFLGGLILVVIGLIDDKIDLKSFHKLGAQFLAALVVVAGGVGIAFITNPLFALGNFGGLGEVIRLDSLRFVFNFFGTHSILILADIFAVLWIVWVINMVNFSTGVDGQMPGIVVVALFVIFAAALRFIAGDPSQMLVARLALIGAGATAGFLIFNFYPARIFPGDSGSYFLGFLIAVLAILSGAKVGTAILVMAVPLIDGVFTIIRRLLSGKSPFLGDRGHLHHQLMQLGWGQRRISLFYWLVCAILGAAALGLQATQKLFAGVFIATIVIGVLLWLNMNLSQKHQR
ncbi:MAG: MraY family glycosyltransferase [Candidatus Curtissbacteria bacterium]